MAQDTETLIDEVCQRLADRCNVQLPEAIKQTRSLDEFLEYLRIALGGDRGQKPADTDGVQMSTLSGASHDDRRWIEQRARRHSVR